MKSYLALFAGLVACALLFSAAPAAADEDEFVLTIDSRDYKDALEKYPLILGEFYAPWLVHLREKASPVPLKKNRETIKLVTALVALFLQPPAQSILNTDTLV